MELEFSTEILERKCKTGTFFKKKNIHMNRQLVKRLNELDLAPSLLDIKRRRSLYNLHPLTGDRKYELSIDIDGRKNVFRIIFETIPKDTLYDDFRNEEKHKQVTKIRILEVTDKTH